VTAAKQTTDGGDASGYMTAYTYTLAGAIDSETYPSGRVVKNVLDASGDLSKVESARCGSTHGVSASCTDQQGFWSYAKNLTFNAAGAVTSMQLGNGKWESTVFNSRLQPTQIALGTVQNGYDKLKLNYTYNTTGNADNNGNIQSQTITVPTVGANTGFVAVQNYNYDSLNRLKDATENVTPNGGLASQSWKQAFTFDRYGNRNFDEANTTTLPKNCGTSPNFVVCTADRNIYNPGINGDGKNRLNASNGYGFDNAGNTAADAQGRTFVYDAENKQISVSDPNGTIGQYFYDGDGKRVKKHVPSTGETTIFVYDAAGKQIAEYSTIVANSTDAKVNYLTADHLGSPRVNTDQNGNVTARHDFHPFGEEIATSQRISGLGYGDDTVRKQFTGYERDIESDLDFAQARMFGYSQGRFTSPDPLLSSGRIQNPQSWNRYPYVLNNPLNLIDPTGMVWGYYDVDGQRHFHWFDGKAGKFGGHSYSTYNGPSVVDNTNAGRIRLLDGGGYKVLKALPASTTSASNGGQQRAQTSAGSSTGGGYVNHALINSLAEHGSTDEKIMFGAAGAAVILGI
jgi:RHS repeat-associated protein